MTQTFSKRRELIRERVQLAFRMAEIDEELDKLREEEGNDVQPSNLVNEIGQETGSEG